MGHPRDQAVDRSRSGLRVLGLPLALLAVLLLGVTLAARPAPAHAAAPVASEPYDRQELSDPPGAVTLAFGREVDPSAAKIIVSGPDGRNVTSGPLIVEGTNVTSRLRDGLPRGTYTVHYRVDGSGGRPEGGAYQFSYGSGRFTDLPDRSWSGEDEEPAVLRGTDPNGSEAPDAPTTTLATPGIEVTSEGATTDPEPPATDPPSTVQAPPGETTEAGSGPASGVSASTEGEQDGSSGTPWIVGGVLLLVAVAGAGLGVWRSRRPGPGDHA